MTNIGILGDLGRMAGEQLPNSMLTAGKEMIDAGGQSGRGEQKRRVVQTRETFGRWVETAVPRPIRNQ